MKHSIFLKKTQSIQLGHLYEHLVCISLVDLLSSKKLYKYVDYDLIGKTYHGGMVYIELRAYNKKAQLTETQFKKLDLNLSEERVETAIRQMSAEHANAISISEPKTLLHSLSKLHSNKWYSIDDLNYSDALNEPVTKEAPVIFLGDKTKTSTVNISFRSDPLQNLDRKLLPLARQLYKLLAENLTDTLCDTYGLFNNGDDFRVNRQTYSLQSTLVSSDSLFDIHDGCIEISKELFKTMLDDKALNRFAKQLHSISYIKNSSTSVSFERTFEDTLIFMGSIGWKNTATHKNILKIVQTTTLDISFKKDRVTLPLSSLL